MTGRPVHKSTAMTGEVTLRGRVLPIGGLKEKTLAAKRLGITKLLIPKRNKKDLEEIPKYIKKDIEFTLVDTMDEVLKAALKKGRAKTKTKTKIKIKSKVKTKTKTKTKAKAKKKAK
jgi:ATP-dependent Lon protease